MTEETSAESSILIVLTSDGSPTAQFHADAELMHSSHGAWSETIYIYQPVVQRVLDQQNPLTFLSVGLGLGYVEMMTAAEIFKNNRDFRNVEILSFENHEELRREFQNWIQNNSTKSIFDLSLEWVARAYEIEPQELKQALRELYLENRWRVERELADLPVATPCSGIFYDAFSKKSGETIWSEEFLIQFLKKYAGPACAFATYASTSALKRALKVSGFSLMEKTGFTGKRESTFAVK
ncbi:MAG: MnmC family methyltransferase [Bdellovibrionales bacterium]